MSDPYAPNDDRPVQDQHEGKIEVEPGVWISYELYVEMMNFEGAWKRRIVDKLAQAARNIEELKRKGIL